jgi:SAM-dependent methyltransferase/septal ring factor EnvC (AmiA/AmiB activator)
MERRWWLWGMAREMSRLGADLVHGPDFAVPYIPRRPSVLTLHDLSPWMDAAWRPAAKRVRRRTPILLDLGIATMIVTPGEAVRKQDIDAGHAAGCATVWIDHGYAEPTPFPLPARRVQSLAEAVAWILAETRPRRSSAAVNCPCAASSISLMMSRASNASERASIIGAIIMGTNPDSWLNGDWGRPDEREADDRIGVILTESKDLSCGSSELQRHVTDWVTQFHLGASRANLLQPFREWLHGNILEVGAGCGPITRFLGETGLSVVALERNERRCEIIRQRCHDLPNVAVHHADVFDWAPKGRFEIATCIGPPEYVRPQRAGLAPIASTLERLREHLNDDGYLILALDNQLALRSFAAPADGNTDPFLAVDDVSSACGNTAAGRRELERLLREAGFAQFEFFYPFPDYRWTQALLSEKALTDTRLDVADLIRHLTGADRAAACGGLFAEELAWSVVARNNLVSHLANSFLVIASPRSDVPVSNTLAWSLTADRCPYFAKVQSIKEDNGDLVVVRRAVWDNAAAPEGSRYERVLRDEPFFSGRLYIRRLYEIVNREGWSVEEVAAWSRPWFDLLRRASSAASGKGWLPRDYVDCTPFNLIERPSGELQPFDLEYAALDPLPLDLVVFRGLWASLTRFRTCASPGNAAGKRILDIVRSVMCLLGLDLSDKRLTKCIKAEAELAYTIRRKPREETETTMRSAGLAVRRRSEEPGESAGPTKNAFACMLYWSTVHGFNPAESTVAVGRVEPALQRLRLAWERLPAQPERFRLDLADRPGLMRLYDITLFGEDGARLWSWDASVGSLLERTSHQISFLAAPANEPGVLAFFSGTDPYVELPLPQATLIPTMLGGSLEVTFSWPVVYRCLEAVVDRAAETQERVAFLETICEQRYAEIVQLEQRLSAAHSETTRLSGKLTEQEKAARLLSDSLAAQQTAAARLEEQFVAEQVEVSHLSTKLAAKEDQERQLTESLAAQRVEIARLEERLAAGQAETARVWDKLAAQEAMALQLGAGLATQQAEAAQLSAELAAQQETARQLADSLAAQRTETVRVEERLAAEQAETGRLLAELAAQRETARQLADSVAAQRTETARVEERLAAEQVETGRLCAELAAQQETARQLADSLAAQRTETARVGERLAVEQAETGRLSAKSAAQEEMLNQYRERASVLQHENSRIREQWASAQSALGEKDLELQRVLQSLSWRLSSPLRWPSTVLRRAKARKR